MNGLHLGDCLEVLPTLPSDSVQLVCADLPYGGTDNHWDSRIPLAPLWQQLLRIAKVNAAFVFTATQPFATVLINSQPKLFRYDLVWDKKPSTGFLNAKRAPLRSHEHLLIFYRRAPSYTPQKTFGHSNYTTYPTKAPNNCYITRSSPHAVRDGSRYPRSIVSVEQQDLRRGFAGGSIKTLLHPTQKPVALLEWLIKTYSNEGDTVLDPCAGSFTTAVACINTKRSCIAIEKDAGYFAIGTNRLRAVQGEAP